MAKTQTERQKVRDDHPDSWIAVSPGDTIMGKVVDVTDAWSDKRRDPITGRPGSSYPLLTIEAQEANGYDNLPRELKVHAFGAVLFNEIMRKQPKIGEIIRVTYTGTGETKPGMNPPELYTVRGGAGGDAASRAYASIPTAQPRGAGGQMPLSPETAADEAAEDIPY